MCFWSSCFGHSRVVLSEPLHPLTEYYLVTDFEPFVLSLDNPLTGYQPYSPSPLEGHNTTVPPGPIENCN